MKWEGEWSFRAFTLGVLALFALLVLAPLAILVVDSLWIDGRLTLSAYADVLGSNRQWTLLGNSLAIAAGSTALAALLGIPAARALWTSGTCLRKVFWVGIAAALLTPPYVMAVAWIDLVGRSGLFALANSTQTIAETGVPKLFSIPGVVFVHGLCYYPIIAIACWVGLKRYDQRFSDAARLSCSPWRAFLFVRGPLLLPWACAGSLFVFLLCLVSYAVPSLLQVNTYPVEIYSSISAFYDFPAAVAQGAPLVACGLVAMGIWALWLRPQQAWLTGARRDSGGEDAAPSARVSSAVFCVLLITTTAGLPLGILVARAMPPGSFLEAWSTAREEIAASLLVAGLSATLLTFLAFSLAYLERRRLKATWILAGSVVAFLVSGPLLGRGLILVWNHWGLPGMVFVTFGDA